MSPDLEALARELDELGKTPARREPDVPPNFGGTDWRLVRQIGHGTMGTVYEAEQISLARKVAIKVLPVASMLRNALGNPFSATEKGDGRYYLAHHAPASVMV